MKAIFIILVFVLSLISIPKMVFSQYGKTKFQYREMPKTGELVAIGGISLIALSVACGFQHKSKISEYSSYVGGFLCITGIGISISIDDKKLTNRTKKKGSFIGKHIKIKF